MIYSQSHRSGTRRSALQMRSQNVRTGLILIATFTVMFVGSVIYIVLYH
jgi:hypothetical protein